MESFFSQTWEDKEYIVIDGGSTDGTADIIKEYAERLVYWCSEGDHGIYDAMNKGISHATGEWVNILNSGDYYATNNSLEKAITNTKDIDNVEVIYGNSIEISDKQKMVEADDDVSLLEMRPIYRHGSSLVRRNILTKFPFDLSKEKKLGFSLDWNQIFQIYKAGYRFKKSDATIQIYALDGTSNQILKSLKYNYKITTQYGFSLKKLCFYLKCMLYQHLCNSWMYKLAHAFLMEYIVNDILPHIPFWAIRKQILKCSKLKIGKESFIMKRNYFLSPSKVVIGEHTTINRGCFIDGRGGINIGNNVSISHEVKIVTGSHDVNSTNFQDKYLPINIHDYAWLGVGCTILQDVTIGKGAVVSAGAVVTKDVADYDIVAGIPAKKIGTRNNNLKYKCIWDAPFT